MASFERIVQQTGFNAGLATAWTVTFGSAISAGRHLFLHVGWVGGSGGTSPIGDSRGNTWTKVGQANTGGGGSYETLYHCRVTTAIQVNDTLVIGSGGGSILQIAYILSEFSGLVASAQFDQGATAGGFQATPLDTGNTGTTAQADEVLIGYYSVSATISWTATTGFTIIATQTDAAANQIMTEYRIVNATGVFHGQPTMNPARNWGAGIATFKALPAQVDADIVVLKLTPSTTQEGGPRSDADTALLKLTPSGTDVYAAQLFSDAATVPLKFKIPEDDVGTVRLRFTPASEDVGPFTDAATVPLLFTPFGTPGAITDSGTVRFSFTPSGLDSLHQCKPRFAGTLLGWSTAPDDDHFYKTWIGSLADRQWQGELLPMEAVVNHPC